MRLKWTRTALHDLNALHSYIALDDPAAADRFVDRILEGVQLLPTQPEMGRSGRVPQTREFVVPPYVVAYRVRQSEIAILAIIHSARRWPDSFA
ncbi:MAG: type II toxin-antitoxin system RelE/ParE family toxin [Bryobacteraceae bacterium]